MLLLAPPAPHFLLRLPGRLLVALLLAPPVPHFLLRLPGRLLVVLLCLEPSLALVPALSLALSLSLLLLLLQTAPGTAVARTPAGRLASARRRVAGAVPTCPS